MWTCPKCNREFLKIDQTHSCEKYSIEVHFDEKNIELREIYDLLISKLEEIGEIIVDPVKNTIILKNKSAFASVTVLKNSLTVKFLTDGSIDIDPIHKSVRASKTRDCHFVKVHDIKDIDKDLISWLKHAYELNK